MLPNRTAEVKANSFNRQAELLRKRVSPDAWQRLLETVTPETRKLLENPPLASLWIPAGASGNLLETAHRTIFRGVTQPLFDVGREEFREDISTLYRVFLRVTSPKAVAQKAGSIWQTYMRGAGGMEVVGETDKSSDILVRDVPAPSAALWAYLHGAVHGVADLAKAEGMRVDLVDGGNTLPRATFRLTWK